MIAICKAIGTSLVNGCRYIKAVVTGKSDVQETLQVTQFGIDSNPVDNINAVYANTLVNNLPVALGIIYDSGKYNIAEKGETRLFSTSGNGTLMFNVWLRADGSILIGQSPTPSDYVNFLIKWNEFDTTMQAYLTDLNEAIAALATSAGGAYAPPTPPDFNSSKTDNIKTI